MLAKAINCCMFLIVPANNILFLYYNLSKNANSVIYSPLCVSDSMKCKSISRKVMWSIVIWTLSFIQV